MILNPKYEALQQLVRDLEAGAIGTEVEARLYEVAGWHVRQVRHYWRRRRPPARTWQAMTRPLWHLDDAVALVQGALPAATLSIDIGQGAARCRISPAQGAAATVYCAERAPQAVMLALVHALMVHEPRFLCETCGTPTHLVDQHERSLCHKHGTWRRPASA